VSAANGGLRLLEVDLQWPPEAYLCRKLEGLAARGLHVSVASRTGRRGQHPRLRGVRLVRLPAAGEGRGHMLFGAARDAIRLAVRRPAALRRLVAAARAGGGPASRWIGRLRDFLPVELARPDVVHFEWESAALGFLALFGACGRPVIVSSHGGIHLRPRIGDKRLVAAYPALFEQATAVHCVSGAVREAAARFGLERSKARVIRTAVDTAFFTPPADRCDAGERLRVVSVGFLAWHKGHDDALKAVALLAHDGVPVSLEVLGGEPPAGGVIPGDRARLLFLARELGLDGRVTWCGEVAQERVRESLRRADVLLQASLTEGLPNSLLEGMACGVPVVATDCGGVREAVEHGVEGLICPIRSPRALADALAAIYADPALARRMGEAGRARVEADFALGDQIDRFQSLYRELARAT
jgi:glycosyltransferase involved in cell wall biosynthesis